MGIICHEEPIELTLRRIANRDIEFCRGDMGTPGEADFVPGTNPQDAIKHGFVRNLAEWERLYEKWIKMFVSNHSQLELLIILWLSFSNL
jgi:hypothetical protein